MHRATIGFRHAAVLSILAMFCAFLCRESEAGGIPNPPGTFSATTHGSIAVCVDPTTFAAEPCTTKGTLVLSYSFAAVGMETRDATGGCLAETAVSSPLPPSTFAPIVNPIDHLALKLLDYDPATGTGDASFIGYDGGKCVGAKFDKTGATETNSGTNHFVISQNGNRIDVINTANTDKENSYGSFLFYGAELKQ